MYFSRPSYTSVLQWIRLVYLDPATLVYFSGSGQCTLVDPATLVYFSGSGQCTWIQLHQCTLVDQASVLQWIRLAYFSEPTKNTFRTRSSVLQWIRLVYFSGSLMTFRARIFMFSDPLKYTSFFPLTFQNLVYFSGPKFGKIKYISFFLSL